MRAVRDFSLRLIDENESSVNHEVKIIEFLQAYKETIFIKYIATC